MSLPHFFRPSLLLRGALILVGIQLGVQAQTTAPAAPAASQARAIFDKADADHSGQLSPAEAAALPAIAARFEQLDADRSGQLSFEEFAAGLAQAG